MCFHLLSQTQALDDLLVWLLFPECNPQNFSSILLLLSSHYKHICKVHKGLLKMFEELRTSSLDLKG